MTQGERIAALEAKVSVLIDGAASVANSQKEMNRKLDDLLALRNKGAGAFWLASTIFGTTIIGSVGVLFNWIKL